MDGVLKIVCPLLRDGDAVNKIFGAEGVGNCVVSEGVFVDFVAIVTREDDGDTLGF